MRHLRLRRRERRSPFRAGYQGDQSVVATAKEVEALGASALPIQCDVCHIDQINRSVDAVIAEWGTVDILVNNAADHLRHASA